MIFQFFQHFHHSTIPISKLSLIRLKNPSGKRLEQVAFRLGLVHKFTKVVAYPFYYLNCKYFKMHPSRDVKDIQYIGMCIETYLSGARLDDI